MNYNVDPHYHVHSSLGEQSPHALHGFCVFGLFTSISHLVFLLSLMLLCYIYAPFTLLCCTKRNKEESKESGAGNTTPHHSHSLPIRPI